jgi:hypothetical protein
LQQVASRWSEASHSARRTAYPNHNKPNAGNLKLPRLIFLEKPRNLVRHIVDIVFDDEGDIRKSWLGEILF